MNRKLLLHITLPAVIFGLLLFSACLLSIRYIHRLQSDLASILAQNLTSFRTGQELELCVRQLRFHTFRELLDPQPERLKRVEQDQSSFELALKEARDVASTDEEKDLLDTIDRAYQLYKKQQNQLIVEAKGQPLPEIYRIADRHPVQMVVLPCQQLLRMNETRMKATRDESVRVSQQAYMAMLFLGVAGPVGGLVVGFGVARGLRRTFYRLSVGVHDMAQHLGQGAGSVSIIADGNLDKLEERMQHIVRKVAEVARRTQQQQRELLRTEQLSQVGQLAAGMAHEIRNPLTGIKLLAEAALRPTSPRPINIEDTEMILREVRRLETTVQQFLNFARLPAPQMASCDLRAIVRQAWDLVRVRAGQEHVELLFHLPTEKAAIRADAGQLTTVLVNLFLNALDAVGTNGNVEVFLDLPVDGIVSLSICDTGPGIAPEVLERLFQPFATNKPHGTGLGLFLTHRILEEHGGSIHAANRPQGGACFTILLPALPDDGGTDHEDSAGH